MKQDWKQHAVRWAYDLARDVPSRVCENLWHTSSKNHAAAWPTQPTYINGNMHDTVANQHCTHTRTARTR